MLLKLHVQGCASYIRCKCICTCTNACNQYAFSAASGGGLRAKSGQIMARMYGPVDGHHGQGRVRERGTPLSLAQPARPRGVL